MRIKRAILLGLYWLCSALDWTPGLCRTNTESWLSVRPRRYSDLGCAWGIAMYAVGLERKWQMGHWAPKVEVGKT